MLMYAENSSYKSFHLVDTSYSPLRNGSQEYHTNENGLTEKKKARNFFQAFNNLSLKKSSCLSAVH